MTPDPVDREIQKLRSTAHIHANRITDHEGRLVHIEKDMEKVESLAQEHTVALARGQKVMEQIETTSRVMNKTVVALEKTVNTIDHSIMMFAKLHKYIIFPILVSVSAAAIWGVINHLATSTTN